MEERKDLPPIEEEEIDLYELWQRLKKRGKLILGVFLAGTVLSALISFLMTPVYRSEALLLPVSNQPSVGIAQLASEFLGIQAGGGDLSSKIMAVLKSRTIKERVVKKLNLVDVLLDEKPEGRDPLKAAVDVLEKMVSVSSDRKTGAITLRVDYEDPEVAARIAGAYIEELRKILEEKALTVAKANRIFLEKQLVETEKELRDKLRVLASFQKKEKVIVPQEQVKGSIELYSELVSRKIALQVKLRELESVLSPSSPQILALKEQIKAIDRQLYEIENSAGNSAIPSLGSAPEKISRYTSIFIKVKGLQAKYETLLKLYEQARMEEQKNRIYVEVIDPPSVPDVPAKPKKKLIVAVAGVSSLFLGVFLALFLDWVESARSRYREMEPVREASRSQTQS